MPPDKDSLPTNEESNGEPHRHYSAYLVRCRQEDGIWHFSLERISDRQRDNYTSLEALVAALKTATGYEQDDSS